MVARHCAISAVRKAEKPQLAGGSVVAHIAHWMPTSAVSTFTRARAYKRKGLFFPRGSLLRAAIVDRIKYSTSIEGQLEN